MINGNNGGYTMTNLFEIMSRLKGTKIEISFADIVSTEFEIIGCFEDYIRLENKLSKQHWIVPINKINYVKGL